MYYVVAGHCPENAFKHLSSIPFLLGDVPFVPFVLLESTSLG
jgi:hypothetical protein